MSRTATMVPVQEMVFDLSNTCQCEGCCRKISKVINRMEGTCQHWFQDKKLIIKSTKVDPSDVVKNLSKVKKHVRFVQTSANQLQRNLGLPDHHPSAGFAQHGHPQGPNHMSHPTFHSCNNEVPPSSACHCHPQGLVQDHFNEPLPPSSACHCPHLQPFADGLQDPLPHGPVHIHFSEQPPPSSACHCPPPTDLNHGPNHSNSLSHHHAQNDALEPLENFLHGPASPLIPADVSTDGLLRQLGNIKTLKKVDLINKKGIKLTFENGHVTSYHPTSSMELRPGYDYYGHPRYVSPFSEENPNALCSIM